MNRFEELGLSELDVLKDAIDKHLFDLSDELHTLAANDGLRRAKVEHDLAVARRTAMKLRMQRVQVLLDMPLQRQPVRSTAPARLAA